MVGLLHAMAFMVLLLVSWVIWKNKPIPFLLRKYITFLLSLSFCCLVQFQNFFCGFQTEQWSKIWWCIEIKKTSRMSGIFWAKLSETQMKSVCWMITNSYPPLEPELQTDQSLCWLWTPFCYTFSTDQHKVSSNSTMCCQTKPTAVSNKQECNYTMTWSSSANWKRLRLWTRWSVCRPHTGPVRLSGWLNIFTQLYAGYAVVNGLPHWTENGF